MLQKLLFITEMLWECTLLPGVGSQGENLFCLSQDFWVRFACQTWTGTTPNLT